MKIVYSLIFTLAVIFNSIELSTQSDGSSSKFRSWVPASVGSSTRAPLHGSLNPRSSGEHSGVSSNDILLPLALDKYPVLAKKLKKNWPYYIEYYYFVQTAYKWKSEEPDLQHTIYCPRGDVNSNIFVAISSFAEYDLLLFAHKGFEHLLYKAVTETRIIEWNKQVRISGIHSHIISTANSIVETLKKTKGIEIERRIPRNCIFKPKEELAALEVRVPEGCYLKKLDISDVPLMHSMWIERNEEHPEWSTKLLLTRLRLGGGLGLYSKENNELLSWVLESEFGRPDLIQTIGKCKKNGYAKLLASAVLKKLGENGQDYFGFIVAGNLPSETMLKSLNSNVIHPYEDLYLKQTIHSKL